jgi:hypothetical protein
MGNPQAELMNSYLQKYRSEKTSLAGLVEPLFFGGQIVAAEAKALALQPRRQHETGSPGFLRMAFMAMKSMARFVGSGCKPAPAGVFQKRLHICGACEHHTGLRCKLCGCFTRVKAWMPHERCPMGKWEDTSG